MSKKIPAYNEDGGEIVSMVMIGALMGFLFTGIFLGTIGFLIDCMSGEWAWRWTNLLGGVVCIGAWSCSSVIAFSIYLLFLPHNMTKSVPKIMGIRIHTGTPCIVFSNDYWYSNIVWVVPKWLGV